MNLEICGLDSAHFAHELAQQIALIKEKKLKLDLLTVIGVINSRKGIRGGICHAIH